MRLVSLDRCEPGIKLGKSIYNENGKVLLTEGTELTKKFIKKLKKCNVTTIYIEDEESVGIEVVEAIPAELRWEAVNKITEGFKTIAELDSHRSNIQGMMKSGRIIRSFQKIFKDILNDLSENQRTLNLLATTKIHENYVYNHSLNVSIYACQLALENGLPLRNIEEIGLGAMLHDFGKVFVPREILNKPEKLTKEEYEQVKLHCEKGFETLRKVHEIPLPVAHCALQHHERMDGLGYPRGLKEDQIHKYAKILSVVDVFDAVTSSRVYRPAMLPHKGLEILFAGSGTQFDRKQVQLFTNCIAIYPQGLTVKLNDGRVGIVSKYNFGSAGRPVIRVIKDMDQQEVSPYEIDLSEKDNLAIEIVEADALM
ncbi:HD-GYP domain-containing protein [Desertibacillus haloalkaliphilus]|uniref:HD-GYP domain-containing protein n=1 Tax=Desertibacillus haloalkaliphilus TaxID=1328930 RepID=UPI001C259960|nr:HD-GYP domain-containing protein [Desertibacillus haloalkaliphilus]MBU8905339.1 HD-GYP domain-containing protein [Desertibacillus haloalkaliphilus]